MSIAAVITNCKEPNAMDGASIMVTPGGAMIAHASHGSGVMFTLTTHGHHPFIRRSPLGDSVFRSFSS